MTQNTDSYKSMPGTPTLTIKQDKKQKMLVWHSLVEADFMETEIILSFDEYIVKINGKNLDELWEAIQLQEVLWVQKVSGNSDDQEGECIVEKIELIKRTQMDKSEL